MLGVLSPTPRRLPGVLLAGFAVLALVPVVNIALHVAAAARNVAYWDEFDTVLSLLLQLDASPGLGDTLARLFEVTNEHRIFTSRLLFATSYWLTGTVNFAAIAAIGDAFLVGFCALLVWEARTAVRRVLLALPLAALLFQLEHYENFLWSGSSIDHFQVVFLVAGAVVGVARGARTGFLAALLCAVLATFTLAHGLLAWPIAAAMLAGARRWRELAVWSAVAALAIGGFAVGFHVNQAESFAAPSLAGAALVAHYWLKLLGAVPALGHDALAPWLGALLLGALAWLVRDGAARREPVALPLAGFGVAALALVALGRAAESHGVVQSRYLVLGALAWALVLFMMLARRPHPQRPYAALAGVLPALALFNLAANHAFADKAAAWVECRDRAALRFKQHGRDGRGPFWLNPQPERATALLNEAERRGLYRLPAICEERAFPGAVESGRITYFVDELTADGRCAFVAGWAAIPGELARRGALHLVLCGGGRMHVFTTVTTARPDVVAATQRPEWELCGFRFARRREMLPGGEFQVGFLIVPESGRPEYILTDHRLRLVGPGKALLATAE